MGRPDSGVGRDVWTARGFEVGAGELGHLGRDRQERRAENRPRVVLRAQEAGNLAVAGHGQCGAGRGGDGADEEETYLEVERARTDRGRERGTPRGET